MGERCDCRVCLAGARGSQVVGSWFLRAARDEGVALSSSLCNCCDLVSKSIIFFCSRTTLVHFFSRSPSYFFAVAASNSFSGRFRSSRSTWALFAWPVERRYAMRDLCLSARDQRLTWNRRRWAVGIQLFGLSRRQEVAHRCGCCLSSIHPGLCTGGGGMDLFATGGGTLEGRSWKSGSREISARRVGGDWRLICAEAVDFCIFTGLKREMLLSHGAETLTMRLVPRLSRRLLD